MVRFGVWLEFLRVQIQGNIQEVALTTFLLASMVIFSSHSLNNLHISFFILSLILSPLGSVGGPHDRHLCKVPFQLQVFHSAGRASNK